MAAACLNRERGHPGAARRQAGRGARRLEAGAAAGLAMGFDAAAFARRVRQSFAGDTPPPPLPLDAPAAGDGD